MTLQRDRCQLLDRSDALEWVQVVNRSHIAERYTRPRRTKEIVMTSLCWRVVTSGVMTMTRDAASVVGVSWRHAATWRRRHGAHWLDVVSRWLRWLHGYDARWRAVGMWTPVVQRLQLTSRTRVQIQTVGEPSRRSTVARRARVDLGGGRERRRRGYGSLDSPVTRYVEVYSKHSGQLTANEGDER